MKHVENYATDTLLPEKMPSGTRMYNQMITEKNLKRQGIADIKNVFLATCDNQNNLSVYVKLDKQNKHGFFE